MKIPYSKCNLIALLGLLGGAILLTVLATPGVFIIDECNYLTTVHALQRGQVTLPDACGLPPSRELLYMAPEAPFWIETPDPLAPSAPPLYALIALPFARLGGWRGLVLLNAVAFMTTLFLVYRRTAQLSSDKTTPWVAAGILGTCTYLLDFSQGVWPHTLTMLLCTAGLYSSLPIREKKFNAGSYALSSLLLAIAAGIRYQNIVLLVLVLGCILLLQKEKWRRTAAFCLGAALPLAASSLINHARYGFWNPISKPGAGYVNLGALRAAQEGRMIDMLTDTCRAFGSRVIDFSLHHPLPVGFTPDPQSSIGTIMCMGVIKKAWLQSCPWLLLTACLLLIQLRPMRIRHGSLGPIRREWTAYAIVIGGVLGLFAAAGSSRIDGMGFNQRYFIELLPFATVAFALSTGRYIRRHAVSVATGGTLTAVVTLMVTYLMPTDSLARELILGKLPILLAVATCVMWYSTHTSRKGITTGTSLLLGSCLAWSATVHLAHDMPATRRLRSVQELRATSAHNAIPSDSPALLVASWGLALAMAPLELSHSGIVIADPWVDQGEDLPALIDAAFSTGKRVYVILNDLPPPLYAQITNARTTRWLHQGDPRTGDIGLVELLP